MPVQLFALLVITFIVTVTFSTVATRTEKRKRKKLYRKFALVGFGVLPFPLVAIFNYTPLLIPAAALAFATILLLSAIQKHTENNQAQAVELAYNQNKQLRNPQIYDHE